MDFKRILKGFSRLDVTRKWVLGASLLVALSTLMPWYQDLDTFGAGDRYLGVTGPLFLVGVSIAAASLFMVAWNILPALGKRLPQLPLKEGSLFTFLSMQSLFLLFMANSVFFHPKFGVNITTKNTRFGMIVAVVGVLVMIISSYQLYKRESNRQAKVHATVSEPIAEIPQQPQGDIATPSDDRYQGLGLKNHLRNTYRDENRFKDRPQPQTLRMDL